MSLLNRYDALLKQLRGIPKSPWPISTTPVRVIQTRIIAYADTIPTVTLIPIYNMPNTYVTLDSFEMSVGNPDAIVLFIRPYIASGIQDTAYIQGIDPSVAPPIVADLTLGNIHRFRSTLFEVMDYQAQSGLYKMCSLKPIRFMSGCKIELYNQSVAGVDVGLRMLVSEEVYT